MILSHLVQKLKKQSSFSGRQGQAAVEYVLMLVVSVAMVMALGYQIFKPFQSFVKSYMGDYTACLLETGELPSLGNSDAEAALSEQGCDANFEAATLAGGRPPRSGGGAEAKNDSQGNKNDGSSGSGSGGSGGGGAGGGSSSGSSNNLLVKSMKKKTATEMGAAPSEKITEIPLAEGGKFYNRKGSYSSEARAQIAKTTYVGIAGLTEEEKKKQERKDGNKRVVASGESFAPPLKKIPVKKPEPKPEKEIEDTPLTFGNFFRFLLIAAIVIAIVVMLGTQILKFAKSQEK